MEITFLTSRLNQWLNAKKKEGEQMFAEVVVAVENINISQAEPKKKTGLYASHTFSLAAK